MFGSLYLDHAATTPCRREVLEAMEPYWLDEYANPNSLHTRGRRAHRALDDARLRVSRCLGCFPSELVFCASGSEANNLAISGVLGVRGGHAITTRIEHHSVLKTLKVWEAHGVRVTYLDVDAFGRVEPSQVIDALCDDTNFVSVMHANNEIGTIQPVELIAAAVKREKAGVLVHCDAVQSVGHVPINLAHSPIDLLSLAAHKFYGPKGIGGLFVRQGVALQPQVLGGGQEQGRRSGTENVALITGMARALELAVEEIDREIAFWTPRRDAIIDGLLDDVVDSRLNGHPTQRLANNVSMSFLGVDGEDLLLLLDQLGLMVSTGSACTTGSLEPSHVLLALGLHRSWASGACRLSFGHVCRGLTPTKIVHAVKNVVAELRRAHFVPVGLEDSLHRTELRACRGLT